MKRTLGLSLALCIGILSTPVLPTEIQKKETTQQEASIKNEYEQRAKFIERMFTLSAVTVAGVAFFSFFAAVFYSALIKQARIDRFRLVQEEAKMHQAIAENRLIIEKAYMWHALYHWVGSFFKK